MKFADRLNRGVLLAIGLFVVAIGAAALCASVGVFGSGFEHHALINNGPGHYVGRNGGWIWPVAAFAAVLIGLLALRWLSAQASSERAGTVRVKTPPGAGTTMLRSGALTDAIEQQVKAYRGVTSVKAGVRGDRGQERLHIGVTVYDRADFPSLRNRVEGDAVTAARTALGSPHLPVVVDYDMTTKEPPREL
jgi:hypothetical protein